MMWRSAIVLDDCERAPDERDLAVSGGAGVNNIVINQSVNSQIRSLVWVIQCLAHHREKRST